MKAHGLFKGKGRHGFQPLALEAFIGAVCYRGPLLLGHSSVQAALPHSYLAEVRNYICDECGQTFKQRKHLLVHKMRHSGAKPLQ